MVNDFDGSKNSSNEESKKGDFDPKSLLGETLKKVFTTGVSAAFMTEESIRNYLQELKLPKEILNLLLQSASKSKDEITQKVSKEIINIFNKIDWVSELAKFAEEHKFRVTAEIDIVKKKANIEVDPKSEMTSESNHTETRKNKDEI
ncbi:MAG: hypothetical protein L6Q37_12095 [Bdellovibrionaceae bacterium]|nr:hypothetical protein [Pseudobdellovibrionaceae bacterium]NUM57991.1 hypothetical protein [Pseudobdellovibrionaceae bacterium]